MLIKKNASFVFAGAVLAVLSACGGGGSDVVIAPPPPPPVAITKSEAFSFLNKATFGATDTEANAVISQRYSAWIDAQLALPASTQLPGVQAAYALLPQPVANIAVLNVDRVDQWFRNSLRGPDQLRQRVAWALSQIMVVSQASTLTNLPHALADYYDMLARDAFGNYRKLLEDVTLHPAMGIYLSMLGNQKPNTALNIRPDENYARECMQLFSVGLVMLNDDGTVKLDASSQAIPTYNQNTIEGFANVYTGWNYAGAATFNAARRSLTNQVQPMQAYPEQHSTSSKQLLTYSGAAITTIPAGQTPALDLQNALDNIFNHPNVGPFISKQLIQKLVTSNPTPAYVARITAKFNNDGAGARGNLGVVVKAILTDAEALTPSTGANAGKVKEPLLRLTQLWRAYDGKAASGKYVFANPGNTFGQGPLQSPSVFNFFSPFYAPPGEIADQNLVAPELQLATEYLNTLVTNYFYAQVFFRTNAQSGLGADVVAIDTTAEVAAAADSEALVTKIADKLLAGQISTTLKAEAKAQVERVAATSTAQRVAEAMYLILSSPEYALQR